jgi:hypothetical protein
MKGRRGPAALPPPRYESRRRDRVSVENAELEGQGSSKAGRSRKGRRVAELFEAVTAVETVGGFRPSDDGEPTGVGRM